MYVCLCAGVSDKKIKHLVESGAARSLCELMKASRAGTSCGACICQLREYVEQSNAEENHHSPALTGLAAGES